jgi:GNAT superfamily N-acetyltransferase
MAPTDLRQIAHDVLARTFPPWLRHQKRGRFALTEGVALRATDMAGPSFNFAAVLGPAPPLGRVLEIADAFFAGREGDYGVLVEGDAGHPAEAELKARGWVVFEDEPALVLPAIPPPAPLPPGFGARRVADEAGRRDFMAVCAVAFGTPAETMEQLTPSLACMTDPDIAFFVGSCEDLPVATAMMSRSGRTAELAGVATLPSHRRRGLGTAITAAALQEGAARGCTNAVLRSGPMSFALYQRMGFLPVCKHRTYAPPGTATTT